MDEPVKVTNRCRYDSSWFVTKLVYGWIYPLFLAGFGKTLKFEDLPSCPSDDDPFRVTSQLEKEWNKEMKWMNEGQIKRPRLMRAIIRTYGWRYALRGQILFWSDAIIRLSQPFMVSQMVLFLSQGEEKREVSLGTFHLMGALICVSTLIITFGRYIGWLECSRIGNNVRTALTAMIYKKVAKISKASMKNSDMGLVLNILANDLQRFEDLAYYATNMVTAPIMIVLVSLSTYYCLGFYGFGGPIIMVLFIPLQGFMGKMFNKFRRQTTQVTDKRVRLMGELISAMKLIKVYCWEEPFAKMVDIIRKKEVSTIRKSYLLKGINSGSTYIGVRLMMFGCFITYVVTGGILHPEQVFLLMTAFNACRIPVTAHFPYALTYFAETLVAAKRITDFLLMHEKTVKSKDDLTISRGSIRIESYNGKWTQALPRNNLRDINLQLDAGQLYVTVGSVGSGKTCLFMALLNEIEKISGEIRINGNISYGSQESWCFGGTIRDNILFGKPYNEDRYKKVVDCCGLERDFLLLNDGDQSFVGEKGYTLSGGQKARVSLARAVYAEADIYLLDDPLSAVDPKVANHIFTRCIKKFLNGKTVILATHQLQFLPQADKVIVLDDGEVNGFGRYDELMSRLNQFLSFIETKRRAQEAESIRLESQRAMSIRSLGDPTSLLEDDEEKPVLNVDRSEAPAAGKIPLKVYSKYLSSANSLFALIICILFTLLCQTMYSFCDLWLAGWTTLGTPQQNKSTIPPSFYFSDEMHNAYLYTVLVIGIFIICFSKTIMLFIFCLRSSINIHNKVFKRVLRATMGFFETNPAGRILNRFTRDIGIIDSNLPQSAVQLVDMNMLSFGIVASCIAVNWLIVIPVLFLFASIYPIREFYVRSARDIQRLDAVARSPVYSHISSTFDGLTTIRSSGLEEKFYQQYMRYLKDSVSCRFLVIASQHVIGIMLDTVSNLYIIVIICLIFFLPPGTFTGADAGMVLASSLGLIGLFQFGIKISTECENFMISVERVFEYGDLPLEAELRDPINKYENWPGEGLIEFNKVSIRYADDLPLVLNKIEFRIQPGEKIGVVGRTGAGKSSLIATLFRLVELHEGEIVIDGIDIKGMGLHDLREKVSIIPQDPSLFSGSIRNNLDPFHEYSDTDMWKALDESNLLMKVKTMEGHLDAVLTEGGTNLSVGQRHLLCLARALLKNNKILVLDEATANVDQETDDLIQNTLKVKCKNCTVLTVAHRLNTIIDMDKVLVMDAGKVVEYDAPYTLLQDKHGLFHSMVKQTGPEYEKMLHREAKRAQTKKYKKLI